MSANALPGPPLLNLTAKCTQTASALKIQHMHVSAPDLFIVLGLA